MINEIVETPSFKAAVEDGFLGENPKIETCILDQQNSIVVLSTTETIDGSFRLETEAIIK